MKLAAWNVNSLKVRLPHLLDWLRDHRGRWLYRRSGQNSGLMTEIVGTDGEFTSDEISFQIRNVIVQEASQVLAKSDMGLAARYSELVADPEDRLRRGPDGRRVGPLPADHQHRPNPSSNQS